MRLSKNIGTSAQAGSRKVRAPRHWTIRHARQSATARWKVNEYLTHMSLGGPSSPRAGRRQTGPSLAEFGRGNPNHSFLMNKDVISHRQGPLAKGRANRVSARGPL